MVKTFGSLIPIGANSLRGQLYLLLVFADYFAKSKVCDFDLTVVEKDILWLQVIVDDFLLSVSQVLEST